MKLRTTGVAVVAACALLITAAAAQAAGQTVLHSFNGTTDGGSASAAPVDGGDGFLYGVTPFGGLVTAGTPDGAGTIYRLDSAGGFTPLHTFDRVNGERPNGLTRAADGWFYGTTSHGGDPDPNAYTSGQGTLFRWNPTSGLEVLHRFWPIHGSWPSAAPTLGSDGAWYGSSRYDSTYPNYGTLWRWTPERGLTVLKDFGGIDGNSPLGPLTLASDGFLYGTTNAGGIWSCGTIFRIAPYTGAHEVVGEFNFSNGCNPKGGVVQASDGNFYGTTEKGGYAGTVFRFDVASRAIVTLHSFNEYGSTGWRPAGPLSVASDGYVYGTTPGGGATSQGVVFRVDPANGNLQVVHEFRGTDGHNPTGGLTQWTDGLLYGAAPVGGAFNRGVIYSLSTAGLAAPKPPVTKAVLSAITTTPTTVQGGSTAYGTPILTTAAPAGGAVVTLTASSRSVTIPRTVTIPEGTNQLNFLIETKRVKATTLVNITASYDGVSKTATLTLTK